MAGESAGDVGPRTAGRASAQTNCPGLQRTKPRVHLGMSRTDRAPKTGGGNRGSSHIYTHAWVYAREVYYGAHVCAVSFFSLVRRRERLHEARRKGKKGKEEGKRGRKGKERRGEERGREGGEREGERRGRQEGERGKRRGKEERKRGEEKRRERGERREERGEKEERGREGERGRRGGCFTGREGERGREGEGELDIIFFRF